MRSLVGYLVLDQPRQRYTHWVEALAPLVEPGAPMPLQVDAYFVAAEDRALLGLWYRGDGSVASALISEIAQLAEIYIIDPTCLSEPDRACSRTGWPAARSSSRGVRASRRR
ncbi:MAG: hypothetical protein HC863_00545 [Myxococcales bacterium]|nr:hypothetical protein [Myxococcales bacterium]